ncbi:extracellular solute-binding protein [Paenibacillus camerounensis]|uniref:extracellular solute-binding protein n=1 Tax=Paenibacillus camerounensis TaxID=1243663 RepID=UPI0005A91940|nr:extracellular solute-binding protein [Paenibacillus camerounensis]
MKRMKPLALSGLLALSLLVTACGGSGSPNGNAGNAASPSPDTAGADSGKLDQAVWFSSIDFWNPPAAWNTDPKSVQGAISEATGLSFEFNIPAQDGDTKLNLMLVSGKDFPDVLTVTNDVMVKKLIQSDKVWDLEEFLTKYDPESHILKDFPADVKAVVEERDGGFYSYPSHINSADARSVYPPSGEFYVDLVDYASNLGIMVNGSILEQIGMTLEDIRTEEGLLAAYDKAKGLKVDGTPVIPLLVDGKGYQDTTLKFLQDTFGAMVVDKDGTYRDLLLAPETKDALSFLNQSMRSGYFEPGQMTVDNAAVKADVASGRVFTFIGNTANTSFQLNDYWQSSGPILSAGGKAPTLDKSQRAGGGWMKTLISKDTKYPEKLAKWLSYMTSKEGMMLHIYGFEGEHYTLDDKGLLVKTEKGLKDAADYMNTAVSAIWPFHHTTFSYSVQQPPTEETDKEAVTANKVQAAYGKDKETHIYDSSALSLPADLFPANSDNANIETQIKAYKEAQIAKIVMSKTDDEFNRLYDELIDQLKKLGIEKLDAERNLYIQQKSDEYGVHTKGINS